MNSPYYSGNVGGGWGPPSGLEAMIAHDRELAMHAGDGFKMLGGAIGGGIGGAMNFKEMGASSAGSGALQGALKGVNGDFTDYSQLKAGGKMADSVFNYLKTMGGGKDGSQAPNPMGSEDEWKTLGAADKMGKVKSFLQTQAMQDQAVKQQEAMANIQRFADMHQAAQGEQQNLQALQKFAADYSSPTPTDDAVLGSMNEPIQFSPQDRAMFALSRNPGAAAAPQFDNTLRSLAAFAPESQTEIMPKLTELGGSKVIYNPKGGNFQVVKSPEESTTPVQVNLPDGSVATQTGNGGWKISGPRKDTSAPAGEPVYSKDNKMYWDQQHGTWKPVQMNPLEALNTSAGGAARSTEVKGEALPTDKKSLVKGKRYQTARGLATWDGEKFITK